MHLITHEIYRYYGSFSCFLMMQEQLQEEFFFTSIEKMHKRKKWSLVLLYLWLLYASSLLLPL